MRGLQWDYYFPRSPHGEGYVRNTYDISIGKLEWKRPLGRSKGRLEDNIKIDLIDIGCGSVLTGFI
jgi:hypothetical protein